MSNMVKFPPVMGSIFQLLGMACPVKIVDVGASPVDGSPPYLPLMQAGQARIVGFEPNPQALAQLLQQKGPHETYLPYAIGDGGTHTLHLCFAPGMNSLLKPDPKVLGMFHYFPKWGEVTGTEQISTRRLDDIPETAGLDYFKIDIQGGELMVFENANDRLDNAVLVHTEVEFLPMYENQPLYGDIEMKLRKHGFLLHRLDPIKRRTLQPMHPYAGYNQFLWADAIFIRDITKPELMTPEQLLKLAVILHECYESYDVSLYLLRAHDKQAGTNYAPLYEHHLASMQIHLAFRQDPYHTDH